MARRPYQFRLASLVWLVIGSAFIFGFIRYVSSGAFGRATSEASTNVSRELRLLGLRPRDLDVIFVTTPCIVAPLVWLFLRRNPIQRSADTKENNPREPAAPIEHRLSQFLSNVSPVESSPSSEPREVILPSNTDSTPPRPGDKLGRLLRRIRGMEGEKSKEIIS